MRIAVVGAGIVGVQTAWQLRRRGHRVVVVSPDVGEGASWAAAGMLAPVSEVQYGQERLYPLMMQARDEYPPLIADLERATPRPHGYLENGTVLLGWDAADRRSIADRAQVQREHGMAVADLAGRALRRAEPALNPQLTSGYAAPGDQQVDPRLLIGALTDALGRDLDPAAFPGAGPAAEWVRGAVERIDAAGEEGWRLTLAAGGDSSPAAAQKSPGTSRTLSADRVLVAAGMGYGRIAGVTERLPLDLRPVHGDVLRLRLVPGQLLPGEDHLISATIRATVRGRQVYLVPRGDGGLVIGASVREDRLEGVSAGGVQELLDDAVTVLPAVKDMELVEMTARARPGTPDDIPYLGRVPGAEGVVVSTGYSRHGILLAPLGARLAADLLTDRPLGDHDAALLAGMDPARFSPSLERTPA
ncbi:FAD-dependent oxidoreductase [Rothia sp. AR01]|uniref:FAD-dependent oxidoreductase n=1 Tax=Rothia santali TaxID=2949643 RepID=A0A9X2KIF9_9MICC|nr:FAD-dependent oxidoreductase [Rothia santali]MCP3426203.1 FAD-dependent oxidoreductase [Rothia santali]